ncbi:hypothetical protein LUZ60_006910 [Juncus effusus]|nr:hypothetical protein LUZ60_006910 [Juncus effusus]
MSPWCNISGFFKGVFSCGSSSHGCRVQIVRPEPLPEEVPEPLSDISMDEIKRATNRFSSSLIIGQGEFGDIYDGTLKDGTRVAVKKARKNTYMADDDDDFRRKIRSLLNLDHRNLVKLYGYLELNAESIFIFEHIPFGNLRQHLNGDYGCHLDFSSRLDIAIDIAQAISHLHQQPSGPIFHGNLKSTNILLISSLKARVGDFGFLRGHKADENLSAVFIPGLGAPEYLMLGVYTEKSDIYSFGGILVEIISGRRPFEKHRDKSERMILNWAQKKLKEGNALATLDPNLPPVKSTHVVFSKMLALAVLCSEFDATKRPNMSYCADELERIREEYTNGLLSSRHDIL